MSLRGLAVGATTLACLPIVLIGSSAPAVAAEGPDCAGVSADTEAEQPVTGENDANVALQISASSALVRDRKKTPGAGITVVVVDSGMSGLTAPAATPLESGHGLVVGSIIAGPDQPTPDQPGPSVSVGIAPAARLVDLPFYAAPRGEAGDDVAVPMSGTLEQRLREVTAQRGAGSLGKRTIVVVPTEVARTDALAAAVDALVASGALVIAASGDRPTDETSLSSYVGAAKPGEDAVDDVWPAAHEGVVSVGASAPGALETVLRNSGVDLAAPGTGSVAKGLNGAWCVVTSISSHWAAAQVAGVAALVWSAHPQDSAEQLRARLESTASGNGAAASPLTGFGVVQPIEAVRRELDAAAPGGAGAESVPRALVPQERADLLAQVREDAVWWGLFGGGALVVLVVLRPVLARRRR